LKIGQLKVESWAAGCVLAAVSATTALPAVGNEPQRPSAPVQGFTVVRSFPHDPAAFTQGLLYSNGELFESTGLYGESSVRRVELATGRILQRRAVEGRYFAEGLALAGDALIQLTWQHNIGFVYDRATLERRRTFAYEGEGWGLAYDPRGGLVLSDGSERLRFLDPTTFAATRTIRVTDAGRPVTQLNELEWIDGEIWANVWQSDRVARIDASSGVVTHWVDLTSLWPRAQRTRSADVLNGIAYDPSAKRIFVTGKKWPRVYEIRVRPVSPVSPTRLE
jgi:glutamine cyclotransferase